MANQKKIDDLIALWLAGEANAAELRELDSWKSESPENAKYFHQFQTIWNRSNDSEMFEDKTATAWKKIQQQMEVQPLTAMKNRRLNPWVYLPVAAAVAGLLIVAVILLKGKSENPMAVSRKIPGIHLVADTKELSVTLPDQTVAILSPGSTLEADSAFGIAHRMVLLKGKAFFKTIHGTKHPFTVRSGELLIRDIGTAFYVMDRDGKNAVWVTEGEVQLIGRKDTVSLFKGDSAGLKSGGSLDIHRKKEQDLYADKGSTGRILKFDKTELSKVVETLNQIYTTQISLGNRQIEHCPLTATFANEKVEDILETIRDVFNLEIQRNGNKIILTGKGCN